MSTAYPAWSQVRQAAGDALQSMNVPSGAKAAALGGAFGSWADDPSAVYWNPAGMAWIKKPQVQATYNKWFMDTFYQDASGVLPLPWGTVGGRLSYVDFGKFDDRDEFGIERGTVHPQAVGGAFGVARRIDPISAGFVVKAGQESLPGYKLSGFGMDCGLLGRVEPFGFGAGIRNFGQTSGYDLPTEYYAGASASYSRSQVSFRVATDAVLSSSDETTLHHGMEVGYAGIAFLRLGYQWNLRKVEKGDLAGFGGGFGAVFGNLTLDYAAVPYGELGLTHWATLGYRFGVSGSAVPAPAKAVEAPQTAPAVETQPFLQPFVVPTAVPIQAVVPTVPAAPAPTPVPKTDLEYSTHVDWADKYMRGSDYQRAIEEYRRAYDLKKTPDVYEKMKAAQAELDYSRHLMKGTDYMVLGSHDSYGLAIQEFEKALQYKNTQKARELLDEAQRNYKESSER